MINRAAARPATMAILVAFLGMMPSSPSTLLSFTLVVAAKSEANDASVTSRTHSTLRRGRRRQLYNIGHRSAAAAAAAAAATKRRPSLADELDVASNPLDDAWGRILNEMSMSASIPSF